MDEIISELRESIKINTFIRATLSSPASRNSELIKVIVRLVEIQGKNTMNFSYRYKTRDITKNLNVEDGISVIQELITGEFSAGTLFTTEKDIVYRRKGQKFQIRTATPTFTELPDRKHDKTKNRNIHDCPGGYLFSLGLADSKGKILPSGQDKFRQINQFIELLKSELTRLAVRGKLKVADMGSGKGYLTFALYDYLTSTMKISTEMTGTEIREDLVELCNKIASEQKFDGLRFVQSNILYSNIAETDILVALHACDTATDMAIHQGITSETAMIVTAPCCHKQIRREIEDSNSTSGLEFITRYGIFLDRQAELITDSLRALILEYFGYSVKVVEFIADAHTHKNVMIIAVKKDGDVSGRDEIKKRISEIKNQFGIRYHELERLTGLAGF